MANQFTWQVNVVYIGSVLPASGVTAGGTNVTIQGFGFLSGAAVTFGGVAATSVVVVNNNVITCTTPAHAAGQVDVVVTNTDTSAYTLSSGFKYEDTPSGFVLSYLSVSGQVGRIRLTNNPISISQTLGQPSTCEFSTDLEPAGEGALGLSAFGVRLFDGSCARKKRREDENQVITWDNTGTDLSFQLRRSFPNGLTWTNAAASTVFSTLLSTFAPAFSANVDGSLTALLTYTLTGTKALDAILSDLCDQCGATWYIDGQTVYVFNTLSAESVSEVASAATVLIGSPSIEWDYSQIRNKVTVYYAAASGAVTQPFVTQEDGTSVAQYGVREYGISRTDLDQAGATAYAQVLLKQYAQPIPNISYQTRDISTRAGKTVTVSLLGLSGQFVVRTVRIDEIDEANGIKPRFSVTATPPNVPFSYVSPSNGMQSVVQQLQQAADLVQQAGNPPHLTGDVTTSGGHAVIPPASITNDQLAGCIDTSKMSVGPTKAPADAATTANITLSGAQTIDGVSVVAGDRVLVKNQTDPTQNGVYVAASGAWTRADDAGTDAQMTPGIVVPVGGGVTNDTTLWMLSATAPVTVGTSALTFVNITGSPLSPTGVTAGTYGG